MLHLYDICRECVPVRLFIFEKSAASIWKNYFSQLLNVHGVSDVRQVEIHTAEPLVLEPSHFEVQTATANLKKYKSPGSEQILA
jgi:hypothetical protein